MVVFWDVRFRTTILVIREFEDDKDYAKNIMQKK
jgi:hypothetical protein